MHKKLITTCVALVAFAALAIGPATASATNDPTLTDLEGHVAVGAKVGGAPIGEAWFTDTSGAPLAKCSSGQLTGTVVKNSGGTVEITFTTVDFWGHRPISKHNGLPECTGSFGDAYITVTDDLCLRSTPTMATHEYQLGTGPCPETKPIKFVIGSTTVGACEYETTGAVKGDYTTVPNESEMTVRNTAAGSGAKKIAGGFFCPSSGMLDMALILETGNGNPINVS
jgi:hypothetical protein